MAGAHGTPAWPAVPGAKPPPRPPEPRRTAPRAHWSVGDLLLSGARPACWPEPGPGRERIARLDLAAEPGSLQAARDLARRSVADWGMSGLDWDATTVVSELLTNAITHAPPPGPPPGPSWGGELRVLLVGGSGGLAVVVTDPGVRAPVLRTASPASGEAGACELLLAEGGRGLHIVDGLSRAWGWAPLITGGKAVWAVLDHAG
ncbi:ATP-binding protein [Spirillospora sp. CA-255316]